MTDPDDDNGMVWNSEPVRRYLSASLPSTANPGDILVLLNRDGTLPAESNNRILVYDGSGWCRLGLTSPVDTVTEPQPVPVTDLVFPVLD